jgi:hypothetical protein
MYRLARAALLASACVLTAGNMGAQGDSLRQLRFSPDGRYVLAQDNSEIAVLTVSPLAVLFRIPAELAGDAQFTPDSQQIVFVRSLARADRQAIAGRDRGLLIRSAPHVERWKLAGGTRTESTEIRGLSCATEQLSPDGRTLACDDSEGTLRLTDVASADTLLERKQFVKLVPIYTVFPGGYIDLPNGQLFGDLGGACMDFSPDGRFLLAVACGGEGRSLAYDLLDRSVVKLNRGISSALHGNSVFVAPHRLLAPVHYAHARMKARLMAFPSGKELSKPIIPPGPLSRAADPSFVLIRPFGKRAFPRDPNARRAAAVELNTGEVIVSHTPALDVCGRYYVAEPSAGTVGLYERGKGLQATVALHDQ